MSNARQPHAPASTSSTPSALVVGDIAELVAYDQVLSDTEREDVESYLEDKWFPAPPPLTLMAIGVPTAKQS